MLICCECSAERAEPVKKTRMNKGSEHGGGSAKGLLGGNSEYKPVQIKQRMSFFSAHAFSSLKR